MEIYISNNIEEAKPFILISASFNVFMPLNHIFLKSSKTSKT